MSAGLSYSIAALVEEPEAKEAALLAVARACPGVEFFDVVNGRAVRVTSEGIEAATAPPHAGQTITRDARKHFFLFEDHGDVLLPGWNPDEHEFEIEIAGEARVLGDLSQMAAEIDETLADDELEEDDRVFLRTVREAIEIAQKERLPIVAHW